MAQSTETRYRKKGHTCRLKQYEQLRSEFSELTLYFELEPDFFSSNHFLASMTAVLDISPTFTSGNKIEKTLSQRLIRSACTVHHQLHTTCQSIVIMPPFNSSGDTGMIYNPSLDDIYQSITLFPETTYTSMT